MHTFNRYFEKGSYWHICNKSIANYAILRNETNQKRFSYTIDYYNSKERPTNLAKALKLSPYYFQGIMFFTKLRIVKIISYCIMLDHYHLLLKVINENCVSSYIGNIQNSFSRYFNQKNHRKGPLWQSRFRCIQVTSNNQLLHVSRYIHLNPTTNGLVRKPEDWFFSSYKDYFSNPFLLKQNNEITIQNNRVFKQFNEDQITYQKKLKQIKKLFLE